MWWGDSGNGKDNTNWHIGVWDEADILSPSQVSETNSSYKSKIMKDFHSQMPAPVREQLKEKMDTSFYSLYYSLDGEQTLRADLLCDPFPNW